MTELQKYLAEEVAEDHADGIITRREAIRRLGLLGVGAAAASTMLAAGAAAKSGGDHGHGHGHGPARRREHVRMGARAARVDHVRRPARATAGGLGASREAARRRPRHPREPRADRAHPQRRGALRGERLLGARARPALGGGRHGRVPGRGVVAAKLSEISGSTPERFDADMKAALTELNNRVGRKAARGDRLLLRRRHDLAAAGLARTPPVGGRAVLRAVPDGRRA